ncbi:MAG: hypothetical protein NZ480_08625 [Bdellovibrionaceae bacterium]|nr:hypothetical protein [Pseudobdellovibrionaceae bacterium]MDW8189609.1 hypothetical protein [Pseudobdellovibrionaceae bacterium]
MESLRLSDEFFNHFEPPAGWMKQWQNSPVSPYISETFFPIYQWEEVVYWGISDLRDLSSIPVPLNPNWIVLRCSHQALVQFWKKIRTPVATPNPVATHNNQSINRRTNNITVTNQPTKEKNLPENPFDSLIEEVQEQKIEQPISSPFDDLPEGLSLDVVGGTTKDAISPTSDELAIANTSLKPDTSSTASNVNQGISFDTSDALDLGLNLISTPLATIQNLKVEADQAKPLPHTPDKGHPIHPHLKSKDPTPTSHPTHQSQFTLSNFDVKVIRSEQPSLSSDLPGEYPSPYQGYIYLKLNNGQLIPENGSHKCHHPVTIKVDEPSPFRIVWRTKKEYHGYLVPNNPVTELFQKGLQRSEPSYLTVIPVFHKDQIDGMWVAWAESNIQDLSYLKMLQDFLARKNKLSMQDHLQKQNRAS